MKKLIITLGIISLLFTASVSVTFAAQQLDDAFLPKGLPTLTGDAAEGPITPDDARVIVTQRILSIVMGGAAIVATYFIINAGFVLTMSGGNDDKLGVAKKTLTWAVIGLLAIVLAYSVMNFIINLALQAEDPDASNINPQQQQDSTVSPETSAGAA